MPNYNFRGYIYITLDITIGINIFKAYLNGSYLITLINRIKLFKISLNVLIKKIPFTIKVRDIADAIYNSSDYILIILKINNKLNNK